METFLAPQKVCGRLSTPSVSPTCPIDGPDLTCCELVACLAGQWARPLAPPMAQPLVGLPGRCAGRAGRPRRRVELLLGGRERAFGGLPGRPGSRLPQTCVCMPAECPNGGRHRSRPVGTGQVVSPGHANAQEGAGVAFRERPWSRPCRHAQTVVNFIEKIYMHVCEVKCVWLASRSEVR